MARLNPAQRAAVEHAQGPLLVLAGAGSGKTRVITQRIARLVERGVRPEAILAVSFTNKAAAEMVERLVPLVGRQAAGKMWTSTFHSFGVRFLREESRALGYGRRFVIFDGGDTLGLVRELLRRSHDRKLDAAAVQARISLWKNRFLAPGEVPASDFEYDAVAADIYPEYEAALRDMRAVDFDDLVVAPVRVLRDHPDIRERWRDRFRHLLVDEFQDTNRAQLELVRLLVNSMGNVCVVGDDDQSIYGWRGAEVGNILDFESHFPGATVVKLEENYRSKAPILNVANAAIAQAPKKRYEKRLVAARGPGERVRLVVVPEAEAEAKTVVSEIRRLRKDGRRWGQMAVLYRGTAHTRLLEEELRAEAVPYRVFGGTQYFDKKEVKDATAYLRAAVHPYDELSLRRILNNPPRGIGSTTVQRLTEHAEATGVPFSKAVAQIGDIPSVPEPARRGAAALIAALRAARRRFEAGAGLAGAARELFAEVGLERDIREQEGPVAQKRWANLQHLLRSLERYEQTAGEDRSMAQFLNRIGLRQDEEEEDPGNVVTLSTLHASKGLEFDVVFLVGCVEGSLPHSRTLDPKITEAAPTDVEEERRLFYVGVTRARDLLYLTRPEQRVLRGREGPVTPSRFLEGLPEDSIEEYTAPCDQPMGADETAAAARAILDQLLGGG